MSNSFQGGMGLYIVDTATPYGVNGGSQGAVTSDTVVISKIRWVSATSANHLMRIADINNNQFYTTVASGANYVEESNYNWLPADKRTLNGLRVVTLSSGIVYIHKE